MYSTRSNTIKRATRNQTACRCVRILQQSKRARDRFMLAYKVRLTDVHSTSTKGVYTPNHETSHVSLRMRHRC